MTNTDTLTTEQKAERFHAVMEILDALNGNPHDPTLYDVYTTEQKAEHYPVAMKAALDSIQTTKDFVTQAEQNLQLIHQRIQSMQH